MKRLFILCLMLCLAFAIACANEPVTEEPPAATEAAPLVTAAPPETDPPVEVDVVTVPKTEWIVTAEEGMPDVDTLSGMKSLKLLDLTALPETSYADIQAISLALPDCRIVWNQRLSDGVFRSDAAELTLPNATAEDVQMLDAFGMLRSVDASGSDAYEALYAFRESHPGIAVHYTLPLGDGTVSESDTYIAVPAGTNVNDLLSTLRFFPNVSEADLRGSGWEESDVLAFVQAFPDIVTHRMIRIGSQTFDSNAALLDLRSESALTVNELLTALSGFASVKTVALPGAMQENDVRAVQEAFPSLRVVGPVTAFGKTFEGGAEEIDLSKIKMSGTDEVEELLSGLPFLKKAVMCDCGLGNEQMETLMEAHPDVRFVWTIEIGKRKIRTDAIGFSTKNPSKYTNPNSSDAYNQSVKKAIRLKEGDIEALKYCTDLEALDLGHNYLTNDDLQVIAGLTKLKILILADNKITDISALTTLKDLEYIELFMNKIPDLSPLTEMPSLIDVNVCNTGVSDLTPLMELKSAKRLWYAMNPFSREQAAAVKAALPDCLCNYTTRDETGEGWRTDPRYQWMRSYFS